jgi:hypothetical protein
MAIKPSDEALDALGDLLVSNGDDNSMFVQDSDGIFLRYDEICIARKPNNLVEVTFRWKGTPAFTRSLECDFAEVNTLTLLGMLGKTKVKLHCD